MHSIRIYEVKVIIFGATVTTTRYRAVCTCGECSVPCATDRAAIEIGFVHLDNVKVAS